MEKCSGHCDHCGACGKNRTENRIVIPFGEKEITNRDLICRDCAYKKRGDTVSCFKYEKKPDAVICGGNCEFFLNDSIMNGGSNCCDGNCKNCKNEGKLAK